MGQLQSKPLYEKQADSTRHALSEYDRDENYWELLKRLSTAPAMTEAAYVEARGDAANRCQAKMQLSAEL